MYKSNIKWHHHLHPTLPSFLLILRASAAVHQVFGCHWETRPSSETTHCGISEVGSQPASCQDYELFVGQTSERLKLEEDEENEEKEKEEKTTHIKSNNPHLTVDRWGKNIRASTSCAKKSICWNYVVTTSILHAAKKNTCVISLQALHIDVDQIFIPTFRDHWNTNITWYYQVTIWDP